MVECRATSRGMRLRIRSPLAAELAPGDSLAVNGVCLTVVLAEAMEIHADVGPETVRVTTLGTLAPGTLVNLERPLRPDGRFGGHFVQGHIDPAIRVLILQRAVDVRQDPVLRKEPHRLIQRRVILLNLMQNRESERQFED